MTMLTLAPLLAASPTTVAVPLTTVPTAKGARCVAADDQAGVWVCDPHAGRLLFKDAATAR